MRSIATITIVAFVAAWAAGSAKSSPPPPGWEKYPARPLAYKDPRTSITLYVESDGRHIAALDKRGHLLWVRCPYEEKGRVRVMNAVRSISSGRDHFVRPDFEIGAGERLAEIYFTSNFFGEINETTGEFAFVGID